MGKSNSFSVYYLYIFPVAKHSFFFFLREREDSVALLQFGDFCNDLFDMKIIFCSDTILKKKIRINKKLVSRFPLISILLGLLNRL